MKNLTNVKSNIIGRAYIYAGRHFPSKGEQEIFMDGVKFAIKRTDIEWK